MHDAEITQDASDGSHTFRELYTYRRLYHALLLNGWAAAGKYNVHKSLRHDDGELCYGGGWFIVVAELPTGQITNHYELAHWNQFIVPVRERAAPYDGHTPATAAERLAQLLDADIQEAKCRGRLPAAESTAAGEGGDR